uniref:Putative crack-1 is transposable element n=2 Tax=Rhipicephalus microplus TaxID=6941 RepID=A0A6M2D2E2_RHIMP
MSLSCNTCNLLISPDEPFVECCKCENGYHFGKCAGLTEKSFKAKNEAAKKSWQCPSCRSASGGNMCSKDSNDSETEIKLALMSINQKLERLMPLTKKVESIEESLTFISTKFDEFEQKFCHQEADLKDIKKKVSELEKKDDLNQVICAQLEKEMHDLEFRSRQLNLELHGIREVANENLMVTLNDVADKLQVPHLMESDVANVHRIPAKHGKVPGIIVRFTKQAIRDQWIRNKKNLKDSHPPIFMQENLTRRNRELLQATKECAKDKGYKFVWYLNGKVLVRKSEGVNAVHVKGKSDLEHL